MESYMLATENIEKTLDGSVNGDVNGDAWIYPTWTYSRPEIVSILRHEMPSAIMDVGRGQSRVYWLGPRAERFFSQILSETERLESSEEAQEIEHDLYEMTRHRFLRCRFWSEIEIKMFLARNDEDDHLFRNDIPVSPIPTIDEWRLFHQNFENVNEDIFGLELGSHPPGDLFTIETLVSTYVDIRGSYFYDLFEIPTVVALPAHDDYYDIII
jgi:hypothetical protein